MNGAGRESGSFLKVEHYGNRGKDSTSAITSFVDET